MVTIDFEDFTKKGLKSLLQKFEKAALPVKEVEANNKVTRKDGYATKAAKLTFESGQLLILLVKAGGSLYQAKLNGKILAIKNYIKPDTFTDEVLAYVKANEPAYEKQKEKQLLKAKVLVPKVKAVNTSTAEQISTFTASLEEFKGQNESIKGELAAFVNPIAAKSNKLGEILNQIDAENAKSTELQAKLDALKSGVMESAKKEGDMEIGPYEKGGVFYLQTFAIEGGKRTLAATDLSNEYKTREEAVKAAKQEAKQKGWGIFEAAGNAPAEIDRLQIANDMMHGDGRHPKLKAAFVDGFDNSCSMEDAIAFINSFSDGELMTLLKSEENIFEAAGDFPRLLEWKKTPSRASEYDSDYEIAIRTDKGPCIFKIESVAGTNRKRLGYSLSAKNLPEKAGKWVTINPDGGINVRGKLFHSPVDAVEVAAQVMATATGSVMESALPPKVNGKVDEKAFYEMGKADGKAGKPKDKRMSRGTDGGFSYLSGYADATGEDFPPNKNKGVMESIGLKVNGELHPLSPAKFLSGIQAPEGTAILEAIEQFNASQEAAGMAGRAVTAEDAFASLQGSHDGRGTYAERTEETGWSYFQDTTIFAPFTYPAPVTAVSGDQEGDSVNAGMVTAIERVMESAKALEGTMVTLHGLREKDDGFAGKQVMVLESGITAAGLTFKVESEGMIYRGVAPSLILEAINLEIDRSGYHDINDPLHVDDPDHEIGNSGVNCPWCGSDVSENKCIACGKKYEIAATDRREWEAVNKPLPADDFPSQYE